MIYIYLFHVSVVYYSPKNCYLLHQKEQSNFGFSTAFQYFQLDRTVYQTFDTQKMLLEVG